MIWKTSAFVSAILWFIADYFSKIWASETLTSGKIVVNSWMNFSLAHNKGAAFSLFANAGGWQRWFFTIIAVVVALWLCYVILVEKVPALIRLAYGFILGGALGNLYDRVIYGHVVDFIQWHLGQYYWPTFNIADVAITIGVALLILTPLWQWWRVRR